MEQLLAILVRDFSKVPITSIGKELPMDWTLLNAETLAHLIWHGTKQKANDPNGAKDLSDSERLGNSEKVLNSLMQNEVRQTSGRIIDPLEAEIMRLATAAIATKIVQKHGTKALRDYKTSDLRKRAEDALLAYEDWAFGIVTDAQMILAAKSANVAGLEIEV